jgi:hypothetical protein
VLTHYGDFNSWEVVQLLNHYQTEFVDAGCDIVCIGMGEVDKAVEFASSVGLATNIRLYSDSDGAVQGALGCSKGFAPEWEVSPWIKMFAMIYGIGSPGTIQEVIKGYTGSKDFPNGRNWVIESLLKGSEMGKFPQLKEDAFEGVAALKPNGEDQELRPFELATLRLQTGAFIVNNWGKLRPDRSELFTRQGGAFVFKKTGELCYAFRDQGILGYAPIKDVIAAARG